MGIKSYKPITPTLRYKTGYTFDEITTAQPHKALLAPLSKKAGRNNRGRITCRHKGGGHKRKFRLIDFKRDKTDIPATVKSIEYDPNRSARICLVIYADGEKRYILWPQGLRVGSTILKSEKAEISVGNTLPLARIPFGTLVHNVEFSPGRGGQLARSAGSYAQVVAKEGGYVHIKMPSGDIHLIRKECYATVGQIGNLEHNAIVLGKAGRKRHMGIRPTVRGVAMNPVDHPMGGGEGKASGGRHPCSPWGVLAKGGKTRKVKKYSSRFIIKSIKKRK